MPKLKSAALKNESLAGRNCEICGKHFQPSVVQIERGTGLYCSYGCSGKARQGRGKVQKIACTCHNCNTVFFLLPSKVRKGRGIYCSALCSQIARGYNPESDKRQCEVCGNHIKLRTAEKYCSSTCYGLARRGENNPQWKGFMQQTCESCGKTFPARENIVQKGQARFCSTSCYGKWFSKNNHGGHNRRGCQGGKREDLNGQYFRSRWEANYARYLNWLLQIGEIQDWKYEADTFEFTTIKRGNRFYTPDFKITEKNGILEYHEIKGWMDDDSRVKITRMQKYYPEIKLVVIDSPAYRALAKDVKNFIPSWETDAKKGF